MATGWVIFIIVWTRLTPIPRRPGLPKFWPVWVFSAEDQIRPCREFSGGWRMRVALAAILFSAPDLLLLDEPTNYLDLEGVLWLENFLQRYRGTVLIVSHDRDLLNTAAEFILHLERGKVKLYTGGYDTFVETRAAQRALDTAFAKKQEAARGAYAGLCRPLQGQGVESPPGPEPHENAVENVGCRSAGG